MVDLAGMVSDRSTPEDESLFNRWRDGDTEAGRALFSRHYEAVAGFFLGKVGEKTPDLVQRTFLACVEGAERYRGEGTFRSYLYGIAYKTLCKHYRERARASTIDDVEQTSLYEFEPTPSAVIVDRQEQRLVLEALRRVPLQVQVILELYYWERMTADRIGEILEMPVGTVRTKIRRGKLRLRELIEQLADSDELQRSTLSNLDSWAQGVRALLG
ncbi:MAG: sigma-70 family RNA polymerase sigma factor [Myxococcota bacterium]